MNIWVVAGSSGYREAAGEGVHATGPSYNYHTEMMEMGMKVVEGPPSSSQGLGPSKLRQPCTLPAGRSYRGEAQSLSGSLVRCS